MIFSLCNQAFRLISTCPKAYFPKQQILAPVSCIFSARIIWFKCNQKQRQSALTLLLCIQSNARLNLLQYWKTYISHIDKATVLLLAQPVQPPLPFVHQPKPPLSTIVVRHHRDQWSNDGRTMPTTNGISQLSTPLTNHHNRRCHILYCPKMQ